MNNRILELGDSVSAVSTRNGLLIVQAEGAPAEIPLGEIAAVVVSHPALRISSAAIASSTAAGANWVFCGANHAPTAMCLPLDGHVTQAERFLRQAQASEPIRKRCWQQIIKAKVLAQGRLLDELGYDGSYLGALAARVLSGDSTGIEAKAARFYWSRVFGDRAFRRDRGRDDQNRFLNYGYAVLRAVTARAICGVGLHPGLGIHHHNRYAGFCLADDLMEPFRALVDRSVVDLLNCHARDAELDREVKGKLLKFATDRYAVRSETRTLFDVIGALASSMCKVFEGNRRRLDLYPIHREIVE